MNPISCPDCGEDAEFSYASFSMGKLDCKSCGYSKSIGKVERASTTGNSPFGVVFVFALGALSGLLLAALSNKAKEPKLDRR